MESHSFSLTGQEAPDLVNYIRNSWDNEGEAVLPEEVQPALQRSNEDTKREPLISEIMVRSIMFKLIQFAKKL